MGDKIAERSKYKNLLLNIITPFTYEKRLNKLLEKKKTEQKKNKIISKPNFYNTTKGFYSPVQSNNLNLDIDDIKNSKDVKVKDTKDTISTLDKDKKIVIERENMTVTKEETIS